MIAQNTVLDDTWSPGDPRFVYRWARFSHDRRYRYELGRVWDASLPTATFCGLNPSKADGLNDDLTVKKWCGFAGELGCGSYVAVNLGAWVSTNPKILLVVPDPVGPLNLTVLKDSLRYSPFVACWGAGMPGHEEFDRVVSFVRDNLKGDGLCLGRTKTGQPRHPCRLPYATPFEVWPGEEPVAF